MRNTSRVRPASSGSIGRYRDSTNSDGTTPRPCRDGRPTAPPGSHATTDCGKSWNDSPVTRPGSADVPRNSSMKRSKHLRGFTISHRHFKNSRQVPSERVKPLSSRGGSNGSGSTAPGHDDCRRPPVACAIPKWRRRHRRCWSALVTRTTGSSPNCGGSDRTDGHGRSCCAISEPTMSSSITAHSPGSSI